MSAILLNRGGQIERMASSLVEWSALIGSTMYYTQGALRRGHL